MCVRVWYPNAAGGDGRGATAADVTGSGAASRRRRRPGRTGVAPRRRDHHLVGRFREQSHRYSPSPMSLSPWPFLFRSGISMAATTSLLRVRYGATVTAIADEKMLDVVVIVWFCFFVWPDQGVSVLSGVHVHARKRHPSPTLSTASTTSSTSATSEGRKSQQHGPKFGASSFWVFLLDCTRFTPRFLLTITPPPLPPSPSEKTLPRVWLDRFTEFYRICPLLIA